MKSFYKYFCITFFVIFSLQSKSQDIHFSQIEFSPTMLNPANTGIFNGRMRAIANYKNQWLALDKAFQTFGASMDGKIKKDSWENFAMGVGGYVFSDVAGDTKLTNTDVNLTFSSIIKVGENSRISAGINGGFGHYSIDQSAMRWGDQYDGEDGYDPTITSLDDYSVNPFFNWNIGAGVSYSYRKEESNLSAKDQKGFDVGFAVDHINKPNYEFGDPGERQYMKFTLSGTGIIGIENSAVTLYPSLLSSFQGPTNEVLVGLRTKYSFQQASRVTGYIQEHGLLFGAYYRFSDALIFSLGYQYTDFTLNISYDVNLSTLTPATSARGGLEISFRYLLGRGFYYKNPEGKAKNPPKPSL